MVLESTVLLRRRPLLLAAAEAQVVAQPDRRGNLRHVLAAHELRANAGQFALMPLRVKLKKGLGHHQSQYRVAQKLQALVVAGSPASCLPLAETRSPARSPARSLWAGSATRSLASERCVSARTSTQGAQSDARVPLPIQQE
jgi:hypothetical protein